MLKRCALQGRKDRVEKPTWDHAKFENPAGKIVFAKEGAAFVPSLLPPDIDYDREIIGLMIKAERSIAELKGMGCKMDDPLAVIRLGLKREAVLSSRIEGTAASLRDFNLHEVVGSTKGASEVRRLPEVINCANALEEALKDIQMPGKRVDLDTMRAAHRTLMSGVRGSESSPGRFRTGRNWIVRRTGSDAEIRYAPPPADMVPELLDNLAEFARFDDRPQFPLVRCAVAHYQFEAIHPFFDGNGRVGRLLIPLMLHESGLMPEPLLYPSAYFERHREEYYESLLAVSKSGRWNVWIAFFLRALARQADESIELIARLAALEDECAGILAEQNARAGSLKIVKALFCNPYITIPRVAGVLGATYPTAKSAVASLVEAGILAEIGGRRRNRVFYARMIDEALDDISSGGG